MERAFGADFSGVQIHRDHRAAAIGAQAFAQGENIHLAPGRGDMASHEGRALIGHELAHVVQQREGRVAGPAVQGKGAAVVSDPALEHEADAAGAAAARGEPVPEVSRSKGGGGGGAGAQAKPEGAPIQMFDGYPEHKPVADEGSGNREYVWGDDGGGKGTQTASEAQSHVPTLANPNRPKGSSKAFELQLTHGDLTMLSGDYFDPRDGNQDSLFDLAARPSPKRGETPGTQDDIVAAMYQEKRTDPRFAHGAIWQEFPAHFKNGDGNPVMKSVSLRFKRLAAKNYEHFAHPDEKHPAPGGDRDSAGGSYHAQHERAIQLAYDAGRSSRDPAMAYAREAAAEHFLTDAFSAGHIRTPRKSINEFWNLRYPNFFKAFTGFMEDKVVTGLGQTGGLPGRWFPAGVKRDGFHHLGIAKDGVHQQMRDKLAGLPPITFGDLLGKIIHDVDNENGLWVINDAGNKWKAFGDNQMSKHSGTRIITTKAVALGVSDLDNARALGVIDAKGVAKTAPEICAAVKLLSLAPAAPRADKYAPEQLLPRPDPDRIHDNGVQDWQAMTFKQLWTMAPRDDLPALTYGTQIEAAMKPGGAFYDNLDGIGQTLEADGPFGLHPKAAFYKVFLEPFSRIPYIWLTEILAKAS
ncbi:MAG: DUF4157 domain-containing protein [Kofleriaceae bacterium]